MGIKAVFDTNILVDYLNGIPQATKELSQYQEKIISIVTWMEVMVGTKDEAEQAAVRRFLNRFKQAGLALDIAEIGITLRQQYRLKLPDAIIYATARYEGCLLVTRNEKDFDKTLPDVRLPYQV